MILAPEVLHMNDHILAPEWPASWWESSWRIADWIAHNGPNSGVHITWNLDQLADQVTSEIFLTTTAPMRETLMALLGDRLVWRVDQLGKKESHRLVLSLPEH